MDITRLDVLENQILNEFSDFSIVKKSESALMRAIDKFLRVITLGKMVGFMYSYTTVIGNKVYVPFTSFQPEITSV